MREVALRLKLLAVLCMIGLAGCVRPAQPVVPTPVGDGVPQSVFATATIPAGVLPVLPTTGVESVTVVAPTAAPVAFREHVVEAGETLSLIAALYDVSVDELVQANQLANPDILEVGQTLLIPDGTAALTPDIVLLPNSRLVRGPGSSSFDVAGFINTLSGYIRIATDTVDGDLLSSSEVVRRVALETSVDTRLLLTLLEMRSHWLSQGDIADNDKLYPMGAVDVVARQGLYLQLSWAANQVNLGYYNSKYGPFSTLEFAGGERVRFAPELNAASKGVLYFLSLNSDYATWYGQASTGAFLAVYQQYFGDPFAGALEPIVPNGLTQPILSLPFAKGETWYFTGGPHGGWGAGSAWAAVDFAPPLPEETVDACYISDHWAVAVAPGVIVRSGDGVAMLDLDMDGDETTGWTIMYLHLSSDGLVAAGTMVSIGDAIGHPSCEGGFSNATHLHIARRFNGEWIPASCDLCAPEMTTPAFTMAGWISYGVPGQEYQGYFVRGDETRQAEQGRNSTVNVMTGE